MARKKTTVEELPEINRLVVRELFMVSTLVTWDDLTMQGTALQWPVSFDKSCGMGFFPVFTTREEAERHYPDKAIMEFREVAKG